MRLDKFLTGAGAATRSEAKKLIRAGRVLVDGAAVTDPAVYVMPDAEILLDGAQIGLLGNVYCMMNKPAGYLSVTQDARAATVTELLEPELRRRNLFPAGRLDRDSEGFLLLTNDGDFCHRLISPKSGVEKRYFIRVSDPFPDSAEELFRQGAVLEDEEICLPALLEPSEDRLSAVVTLTEGKYHQVKRMSQAVGTRVRYLKRLSIGGVELDPNLAPGEYRLMTSEEVHKIVK